MKMTAIDGVNRLYTDLFLIASFPSTHWYPFESLLWISIFAFCAWSVYHHRHQLGHHLSLSSSFGFQMPVQHKTTSGSSPISPCHQVIEAMENAQPPDSTSTTTPTTSSPNVHANDTTDQDQVGICAMDVYFPAQYVAQDDLEHENHVSPGKYTKGLGQIHMSFVTDREDVNSMALTVVQGLMEKFDLSWHDIGRLEVGTETLLDKSKSTKTVLMELCPSLIHDIEGVTTVNACYGGMAALLNAVAWCQSRDYVKGTYALVVAADIAVYAPGPARPTGGAGAVAMLVGPHAPLVLTPGVRSSYSANVWDFYKPDPASAYPTVHGSESQACYFRALDSCYARFGSKRSRKSKRSKEEEEGGNDDKISLEHMDYAIFHSPYNKLVQKSFARLVFHDERRRKQQLQETKEEEEEPSLSLLEPWLDVPLEKTYHDRALDLRLRESSSRLYREMVEPSTSLSQAVGNCYTASIFMNLACLLESEGPKWQRASKTKTKKILAFSYGSGAMASMVAIEVVLDRDDDDSRRFSLHRMIKVLDLTLRLGQRQRCSVEAFTRHLDHHEQQYGKPLGQPWEPQSALANVLALNTYYLKSVDEHGRRQYRRYNDDLDLNDGLLLQSTTLPPPLVNHETLASTSPHIHKSHQKTSPGPVIVITGTSAGLPGIHPPRNSNGHSNEPDHHQTPPLFDSERNLDVILNGTNCIAPIAPVEIQKMLAKHIVQLKKPNAPHQHPGERLPVTLARDCIQIAAVLDEAAFDLQRQYGIPKSLADCMDLSSQVAVAAGLEALKSAGLVRGTIDEHGRGHWQLIEEHDAALTGIIFATSFPALDAALAEAHRFDNSHDSPTFEFNRKFLFQVLVLANAQLAQITGARGPNVQLNAACASTSVAMGLAQDWITARRCTRVVIISGDSASSPNLMSWIGSGFRALGAASLACEPEEGACPFDVRRQGMILASGAVGFVVELESKTNNKDNHKSSSSMRMSRRPVRRHRQVQLLGTQYSNSAFHGAALDPHHMAEELDRFLKRMESQHGLSRADLARGGIYLSHETGTNATATSSCAFAEVFALRHVFGSALLSQLLIVNTKGFTGHPMGVSFEDIAAVWCLEHQRVPPMANFKSVDPALGNDLRLSEKGGPYAAQYALRFAAGFGSQLAFCLYHLPLEPVPTTSGSPSCE